MADQIPDQLWELMKQHLNYSDVEIEQFKNNPRNAKVMAVAPDMKNKTIIFEVIESNACNSQHTVGTRFFFSGDGNLISKMAPSKVCAYILPVMTQAIFGIQELWYAGINPNKLAFRHAGCFDVGVCSGGWGHIKIEASVMEREKAMELYQA